MNQNCHASVKVLESYFNPWMSSNGDVHTVENIPLVFGIKEVDPKRVVYMRLLEYSKDEMFWKIKCLIPMTSSLL